jgi:hypothetical protein
MNKKSILVTTLVAGAALSFGCQERPTAPAEPRVLGPQLKKGGNQETTKTVTFTFRNADTGDLIFGDERVPGTTGGTAYTNDECGVAAVMPGHNGNANLNTKSSPIKRSEASSCEGKEGRVFRARFADRVLVPDASDPLDWDDQTVNAKWMDVFYDIRAIGLLQPERRKLRMTFDDTGEHGGHGNGWGQACPWRLTFDSEWSNEYVDVSEVWVTRLNQQPDDAYDEWLIEARPEDVAVCLGGKSEPIVLGYYHMPFQLHVRCKGEC